MKQILKQNRHASIREQSKRINLVLSGHNRYYGILGNTASLISFHNVTLRYWHKMLNSRSQNGKVTLKKYKHLMELFPLCKLRLSMSYRELNQMMSRL